jgi:hypothetical protein
LWKREGSAGFNFVVFKGERGVREYVFEVFDGRGVCGRWVLGFSMGEGCAWVSFWGFRWERGVRELVFLILDRRKVCGG